MTRLITPVILSGGSGTRLWPLSTPERPKQFLRLGGELTMLQATAARTQGCSDFGQPLVIANQAHADTIEAQLGEIGCVPLALVLEPVGRNTAPAIALAALAAPQPDALLLVMPSDHVIDDVAAFMQAVERAAPLAEQGWLVTFGIAADRPETGFGYIKLGKLLTTGVHRVERFIEKPAAAVAESMLREGGHAWNGGIFLFRAGSYLEALSAYAPEILAPVRAAMANADRQGRRILPDPDQFTATPPDSIDYAVMEKAAKVAVAPVSMGWSDVGSWDAVHGLGPLDEFGTVRDGEVIAIDTANCLIRSDGPTIAAIGVSDLIVVATGSHVLVLPRGRSQDVKRLVEELNARG